MIKLTIQGTPEDLQKFSAILRGSGVEFVYSSDMRKPTATAKWASQKAGVNLPDVDKDVLSTYPAGKVEVFERRRRGTGKTSGKSQVGWVYLMPTPHGAYKIGKTTNPNSRRKTFSTKYPFTVEFIHLIHTSNCGALEKELHRRFADRRKGNSEFFDLTGDDVRSIMAMKGDLE
jgi:hypothetical protein